MVVTSPLRRPFQSTLPAWGETFRRPAPGACITISIHSPRMGRDMTREPLVFPLLISIHSPRMGRDRFPPKPWMSFRAISIHSPRMGRDLPWGCPWVPPCHFNPLSPHGERRAHPAISPQAWHFNPLSPHGERHPEGQTNVRSAGISIHSPRMGRDVAGRVIGILGVISIHSPRMGRDSAPSACRWSTRFQSTLPAWGETVTKCGNGLLMPISIHSPRMGRDVNHPQKFSIWLLFQSTLPAWGETPPAPTGRWNSGFQSTLPAWGETVNDWLFNNNDDISIHSPRMGRDARVRW